MCCMHADHVMVIGQDIELDLTMRLGMQWPFTLLDVSWHHVTDITVLVCASFQLLYQTPSVVTLMLCSWYCNVLLA